MPQRKSGPRKTGRVKAASTTTKSPRPAEAHVDSPIVDVPPEPAPERGIEEREIPVSPGPSDASASQS